VNRRAFLRAGCGACLTMAALARAQEPWAPPARFVRPDTAGEEGGLWALMDREETRLRRSPFSLRAPELRDYVGGIACRLAAEHCPDMRVYLVRVPQFNASMAPNGMMQVWSGLMLRVDNEAQIAAVLGHEIAHYLERHSLERLRSAKSASAAGQFLGLFGAVGLLAQVGLLAGVSAYSRDQESDADRIGALLMHKAGYDVAEAARVWANLELEAKARVGGGANPLFASHPASDQRREALEDLADRQKGGDAGERAWREKTAPFMREWLADEVKRGQHEESLAFLRRAVNRPSAQADYLYTRGEVYRLRAGEGDLDLALQDYQSAAALGGEPPETHRAMGMIYRARKRAAEARSSFERYLQLAPQAPDALMIKTYVEELSV
jgi:beta-barrel assembly-enhancing protease